MITIPSFNRTSNNITSLIPQFDRNVAQFKFNDNYDLNGANEANTYLQIWSESCHLFGSDIVFVPRTPNNPEPIFGEFLSSTLEAGYPMRMFVEDVAGWNGQGDLYSKFGLQINDSTTFHCPKILFNQIVGENVVNKFVVGEFTVSETRSLYPRPGDLIYYVKGKKLFEIQHIEDETQPGFYVFGNRQSYVIKCKAYSFDHMEISSSSNTSILSELSMLNNLASQDEEHYNTELLNTILTQSILDNSEVDPITGR